MKKEVDADMGAVVEQRLRHHSEPRRGASGFIAARESLGNRFVYLMVSSRARGLTVGVNLNPDRRCNFDCVYCDVERPLAGNGSAVELEVLEEELTRTLVQIQPSHLRGLECFRDIPDELLKLRHVAISGDGEPTLCPVFADALRSVVHVRARGQFAFFKIVVLTNATLLDQTSVQQGLRLLIPQDEVWAKLDGGTEAYFKQVNRTHQVSLTKVLSNILLLARQRPVVIQSLFPLLAGSEPPDEEIEQYAHRLLELVAGGAQIPLVQIYSATRAPAHPECGHLPLRTLSRIAQRVRQLTGLQVEVF